MAELVPRILPWIDWKEWGDVCSLLFSPEEASRRLGVDRVTVWRCRGRIPVAVDATASLIEVGLTDHTRFAPPLMSVGGSSEGDDAKEGGECSSTSNVAASYHPRLSDHQLRMMYSMVVTRTVNGLVDSNQTKYFAETVHALAGRMGLPQLLVDLRHDATHNQLPSLSTLRLGAQHLLDWLYQNYWSPQFADLDQCHQASLSLLKSYVKAVTIAQEEGAQSLHRISREFLQGPSTSSSSTTTTMVTTALTSILSSVSPTYLHHFLIPSLLQPPPNGFLLADDPQNGASELGLFKRRQLYVPVLAALQKGHRGFCASLLVKLVEDYILVPPPPSLPTPFIWLWFTYLLSRDFHSHDPAHASLASFSLRVSLRLTVNLRDKSPDRWTTAEASHMAQPAPPDVLHSLAIPVQALTQRLADTMKDGTKPNNEPWSSLVERVHALLVKIRGSAPPISLDDNSPSSSASATVAQSGGSSGDFASSGPWEAVPQEEWVPCPIGLMPGYSCPLLDHP